MWPIISKILLTFAHMCWDIFWGLAFGFILSSIIRAFISTSTISAKLGKNTPGAVGLSTFFGSISSSCSYAAASMARTLIVKGATWPNAVAFMVASTNMVFEIFIVIVSLLGWAFFGGELLGGLFFIVLASVLIAKFYPKNVMEDGRKHLKDAGQMDDSSMENSDSDEKKDDKNSTADDVKSQSFKEKLQAASGYFHMDVLMVGKDILIGVAIASILSVLVPKEWWNALFLKNNSSLPHFLVLVYNSVIGIVIAIFAFVCSVGNIVLASVLWHGGISFGGIIAFILADLITIPMLLVYRNYFGTKTMITLFIFLTISILATSLFVDTVFTLLNWVPKSPENLADTASDRFEWNYETIFNIILIPTAIVYFFYGKKHDKMMM
ncbi:MAG: metal ion permease [Sphingobacteriaceae bacterium]|nr:MAG: metal ion permease [Sphingobacteriaceae bacterium]